MGVNKRNLFDLAIYFLSLYVLEILTLLGIMGSNRVRSMDSDAEERQK